MIKYKKSIEGTYYIDNFTQEKIDNSKPIFEKYKGRRDVGLRMFQSTHPTLEREVIVVELIALGIEKRSVKDKLNKLKQEINKTVGKLNLLIEKEREYK